MQIRNSSPLSLHALPLGAALALAAAPLPALDILGSAPERRSEQFPTDNAYLLVPLPYSMPGIGEGYFLMGYFSNMFGTTADGFITRVGGDAEGWVAQFDEVPLYKQTLFFNVMDQRISKAAVNNYKSRGMNSGKDDYNIVEVNQADERHLGLTLSLFERRLELTSARLDSDFALTYIRDPDGREISAFDPPYRQSASSWRHGISLDLTDDHQDPRKGIRLSLHYADVPAQIPSEPDFFTLDSSLSLYLPLYDNDTLALNYYQSDANVTRQGQTDPSAIRTELGFNCDPLDTTCLQAEQEIVDSFILQRTHGTATSLGGNDRLRSYPRGRFYGGHMAFVGAEYRMNFARDAKPFNYFIWKDVTTSLQLAFFAEVGTVAEASSGLWQEQRTSYGIGGRLLSASGSVYRADYAVGDEGSEVTLFFYYPWR
jgi:hypothetical protein